jgi:hypothetical protein
MGVKPFSSGRTLESLRDSDFDSCSAFGEVIDNSIQAAATVCKVHFEMHSRDLLKRVIFMDDGTGMDQETLQHCLRLGWSSRYNDRSGIGRFGVGMTLGAIHECRRVEVYSKALGGTWLYTYLDLDEIEGADESSGVEWEIPAPVAKNLSGAVGDAYIPANHGTVVIWSKYDRLQDKPAKIINDFRIWAGRTYRYYIWNMNPVTKEPLRGKGFSLYIDGSEVKVVDPLYLRLDKSDFPDDPVSHEYEPIVWQWPITDPQLAKIVGKEKADIHVRFTLLPSELRSYQGAGGSAETRSRRIDMNEGFSFLRHGREVGYDWIPHFAFQAKEIDRWWGCELHFEPCLDRAFTVKNIKRGAVPVPELKKLIAEKLGPLIKQQREKISEDFRRQQQAPLIPNVDSPEGGDAHTQAERIASGAKVPSNTLHGNKNFEEERKRVADLLSEGKQMEAARLEARFKAQPFTIIEKYWGGPTFVDIAHMGGSDALLYNSQHKFFEVFTIIKGELKDGINSEHNAERLVTLIDIMLIAYAKAESMLDGRDTMKAEDLIDVLKNNWGQYLKTYISTWQNEYDEDIRSE